MPQESSAIYYQKTKKGLKKSLKRYQDLPKYEKRKTATVWL